MKYNIFKKKFNRIIKRNRIPIIFVITFILLLGLFVVYNYKPSEEIVEREFLAPPQEEEPKINGYIIELYEKPLLVKETELKKASPTRTASQSSLNSHKQKLINEKENSKQEIKNLLGKSEIRTTSSTSSNSLHILSEYENVFNGFALNITLEEAEIIRNQANVKRVSPNYEVKINLMDSVPLINADDVWQLQDDLGRNITGQNITIAIIDTGIDYTHPDLGGCFAPSGGYCGDNICNETKEDRLICPQDCETTFEPGWPVLINKEQFNPVFANLDEDPESEVIVYSMNTGWGSYSDKLHAFNPDGTPVPGFPIKMYGTFYGNPAIEDIDKDGDNEILLSNEYSLKVYEHDGTSREGFPIWLNNELTHSKPKIVDLNNNGQLEIIVVSGSFWGDREGQIYVFDTNGTSINPWPKPLGENYRAHDSSPITGDIDGDGKLEIVHGAIPKNARGKNSRVYAWNDDGSLVSGFPVELQPYDLDSGNELSTVVLVDADGDGNDEIFIVTSQYKVYGIDGDGSFFPNWPINFTHKLWSDLLFIDVNNDGKKELLFAEYNWREIYAYDVNGSIVNDWPKTSPVQIQSFNIEDINYDGQKDLLISSYGLVYALNQNESIIEGWPKKITRGSSSPPIASDMDNDQNIEILVPSTMDNNFNAYQQLFEQPEIDIKGNTLSNLEQNINNRPTNNIRDPNTDSRGFQLTIIDDEIKHTSVVLLEDDDSAGIEQVQLFNQNDSCKVIGGYDFVNNDDDPMDDHGHGTHVAATAAGNGILKGVAPDAKLYGYKVLDSGGYGSFSDIIAAIERSADPNQDGNFSDHIDIISMSLGAFCNMYGDGYSTSCGPDDPMSIAVDNIVDAGIVAVIAAGNDGVFGENTIGSPGTSRKAITIGATDNNDDIADFSSRGPIIWQDEQGNTQYLLKPDITAPGVYICAAQWNSWLDSYQCLDTEHISISGTSMATPHVAGAVALIKQKNPDWNPIEIKMALRNTAIDVGEDINTQGYGRIDILKVINLNSKPPIAQLDYPLISSNKIINLTGTATAENIQNYKLHIGSGINPVIFEEIYVSSTPVEDGILLEGFDSSLLFEGTNTIKLTVTNTDNITSEDRNILIINNIEITSPSYGDVIRIGDVIEIKGYPILDNYSLEWSQSDVESWSSDGSNNINLDGILSRFDTSVLPNSGFYDIRLTNQKGRQEYVKSIYFDSNLKQGWPVKLGEVKEEMEMVGGDGFSIDKNSNKIAYPLYMSLLSQKEATISIDERNIINNDISSSIEVFQEEQSSSILSQDHTFQDKGTMVADLNKDGNKEIIISKNGFPPELFVYASNGSLLWSKKGPKGYHVPFSPQTMPSIGDIDNDGFNDILISYLRDDNNFNSSDLYVYNYQGDLIEGFPVMVPAMGRAAITVADLNNNNNNEIIIQYSHPHIFFFGYNISTYKVIVLNNTGKVISQWDASPILNLVHPDPVSFSSVGNFDDDSDLEIVTLAEVSREEENPFASNTHIFVHNIDGSSLPGWPVIIENSYSGISSPIVGDINNDGINEIIVLLKDYSLGQNSSHGAGLYIFDKNGNILPGFPIKDHIQSSPALGDFDSDGNLEISLPGYLIRYDGTILLDKLFNSYSHSFYSNIIGSGLSSDSPPSFIFSWDEFTFTFQFREDNSPLEIHKFRTNHYPGSLTISDIDNDGRMDLITSDSDFIYVWELDTLYNANKTDWPMSQHDPQHTGNYNYEEKEVICFDSDNGKNYYLQGTVISEETPDGETDTCTDNNTLVEYFCGSDQTTGDEIYTCPEGCENGACINPICGNNIIEGDEACDYDDINNKTCSDFNYTEGYISCCGDCTGFDLSNCVNIKYTCKDYDNGTNYYNASLISYMVSINYGLNCDGAFSGMEGGGKLSDTCINNSVLIEQTCNVNGTPSSINYTCPLSCEDKENGENGVCMKGCGDGIINFNETCDTIDFNGSSCSAYGHNTGSLACTNNCTTIDSSGCSTTSTRGSSGGGGGGGGGGGSGKVSYSLGDITSSIPLKVSRRDKASFYVGEEEHNMEIIQVKRDYIEIKISSEPITVLIYKGETKKLDLNNDGILDVFITVQNIKSGKADITIDVLQQPIEECNNNYVCELGENSINCPNDCVTYETPTQEQPKATKEIIICDYNEICDNDETPMTCPTDCKRSSKDSIIASLIALFAMVLIIGFFVGEHNHHNEYNIPRRIKKDIIPLLITNTDSHKIKSYLVFKGFKKKEIKNTLKYTHNFNILKEYAIKCKNKGHNSEDIKAILKKNDWSTQLINDVLNNTKRGNK